MKKQNFVCLSATNAWLWLVLFFGLVSMGLVQSSSERAVAQDAQPNPVPNTEATQVPEPTPTEVPQCNTAP